MRMATDLTEQTFEGKRLPRHLKMFRDMDSGRIELRYWKFEPILLFLIPFMSVWSGGALLGCCLFGAEEPYWGAMSCRFCSRTLIQ